MMMLKPIRTESDYEANLERLEQLIDTLQVNHSTVAIQEMVHTIGVLDPDDSRTAAVVDAVTGQIQTMPEHRVFRPDVDILGRGALLAGILSRLHVPLVSCRLTLTGEMWCAIQGLCRRGPG